MARLVVLSVVESILLFSDGPQMTLLRLWLHSPASSRRHAAHPLVTLGQDGQNGSTHCKFSMVSGRIQEYGG